MNQITLSKRRAALLGAVIGAVCFLLVYGLKTLNVMDDSWIFAAYDEFDIIQRYMGQVYLRASDWSFPLMMADKLAAPDGTITVFTDSYPLVMVFVKLLSPFLPAVFQIEGWCVLAHFALQGAAAALLAQRVRADWVFCALATIPFTLSPILLERAFRHTTLSAHFIILLSIYAYLEYSDALSRGERPRLPWIFWVLGVLSVGSSPYFLPMCMIFALAVVVEDVRYRRRILYPVLWFAGCCVSALLFAYLFGSVGHGVSASRGGYNYFSLNLNALFNPTSTGGYRWSLFLPVRPQTAGQYDAFNYLGLGMLIAAALFGVQFLVLIVRTKGALRAFVSRWWAVGAVCVFLTAFALSNIITFDLIDLIIVVPQKLLDLCGIFRASGRLFWPVYYLIMLFVVHRAAHVFSAPRTAALVLAAVAFVQIVDLSPALLQKRAWDTGLLDEVEQLGSGPVHGTVISELIESDAVDMLDDCRFVCVTSSNGDAEQSILLRYLAMFAGRAGVPTNFWDANSGTYLRADAMRAEASEQLEQGKAESGFAYVTTDTAQYDRWKAMYADSGAVFETAGTLYLMFSA